MPKNPNADVEAPSLSTPWNPSGAPHLDMPNADPADGNETALCDDARELAELIADIKAVKDEETVFDHDQPEAWAGGAS